MVLRHTLRAVNFMGKMFGYMLTWTTYGVWLQGDSRGWVKDGVMCEGSERFYRSNTEILKMDTVWLSAEERRIVRDAIVDKAEKNNLNVLAIAVRNGHVHVVLKYDERDVGEVVGVLKNAGRVALSAAGRNGRVWAKGYDKRFCFDAESLRVRMEYVLGHGE